MENQTAQRETSVHGGGGGGGGGLTYNSLMKMGTGKIKKRSKNFNPTLSYLREALGSDTADTAQKNYRPYINRKPRTDAKDVFKVVTELTTKSHQVILFATNNSSTITGEETKNIQRFQPC